MNVGGGPWNFHQTYSNQAVVRSANEMAGVRAWHCRLCQMTTSLFLVLSVRIPRSLSIARFHHRWSSLVHLSGFHLIIVSLFKSENYFSHLLSLVLKVIVWSHSCQYKINQPFASSPSLVCVSPSTLQKHLSLSFCSPKLRCCNHLFLLSLRFTYWQKLAERQSGRQRHRKRDEVRDWISILLLFLQYLYMA